MQNILNVFKVKVNVKIMIYIHIKNWRNLPLGVKYLNTIL